MSAPTRPSSAAVPGTWGTWWTDFGEYEIRVRAHPAGWMARAFLDGACVYSVRGFVFTSKQEAVRELRKSMLARLDRLPAQIATLEAEHARLMKALR